MKLLSFRTCFAAGTLAFAGASVHAAPIDWNTWTSVTTGTIITGPTVVTFSSGGSSAALVAGYPSYGPSSTFADGTVVDNGPTNANGILQVFGGNANVNTVSFSTAVVDPVMAIWSLGQGGINASFNFIGATPTLVSGGPNSEYGGSSITVSGNNVFGAEGNGTVKFSGTFSSISWTNPTFENWYGFNVGIAGIVGTTTTAPIPEPETYAMLLAGLGLLGVAARRRKQKVA